MKLFLIISLALSAFSGNVFNISALIENKNNAASTGRNDVDFNNCTFNGKPLYGNVQVVEAFPDIKVQIVEAFPDIKVKVVEAFPDDCGEWKFVDAFPDIKIQFVEAFPDVKIQYVDAFPGKP